MIRFAFLIPLLLVALSGCTRTPSPISDSDRERYMKSIKVEAQRIADALTSENYEVVAAMTYPPFVELCGGEKAMVDAMRQTRRRLRAGQDTAVSTISDPTEVVNVKGRLIGVVPITIEVRTLEGKDVSRYTMLAVSDDGGTKWTWLEVGSMNEEQLEQLLPEAVGSVYIPRTGQPIIVPHS